MTNRYMHDQKAGNLHDVWKHFILAEYLMAATNSQTLNTTRKPITYIDTHSGSFSYKNDQQEQLKSGVLNFPNGLNDIPASSYAKILSFYRAEIEQDEFGTYRLLYPGSMAIAAYSFLNTHGTIIGCDINEEIVEKGKRNMALLKRVTKSNMNLQYVQGDGYTFAMDFINNSFENQGIVFVDPPYYPDEHIDWNKNKNFLSKIYSINKNWTYILWYCAYTNNIESHLGHYNNFKELVTAKGLNAVDIQLQIQPLTPKYKKAVTGMYIVNPLIDCDSFLSNLYTAGIGKIASLLKIPDQSYGYKVNIETVGDFNNGNDPK